jgi:hypothetical protein
MKDSYRILANDILFVIIQRLDLFCVTGAHIKLLQVVEG